MNPSTEQLNPLTGSPFSTRYFSLLEKRKALPVYSRQQEICDLIDDNQFVVLVGETGSGKTTQVPQFLLHHFNCKSSGKIIGCTQPRRVAATSVATRVAQEMDVKLGAEVGYSVRFDEMTGNKVSAVLQQLSIDSSLGKNISR